MDNKNIDMFLYRVEINENLSMFNQILNNCFCDKAYVNLLINIASIINNKYKDNLPLPSGRYGNILAYAIEMQKYYAALKIFEKKEYFGINDSKIAHSPVGVHSLSVKECFVYSSKLWEDNEIHLYQLLTFDIRQFAINREAFVEFKKIFNIESDKKLINSLEK